MKTNVVRLLPDKNETRLLQELAERVSCLYNAGNYRCRQAFIAGMPVPGYARLCELLKDGPDYRHLSSDIAQEVLKKLAEAWKSFFELRKRFAGGALRDKPGLPRYRKRRDGTRLRDFIPVKCDRSYQTADGALALTLPADLRTTLGRLITKIRGLWRYRGKGGRLEISYNAGMNRWYARQAVDVPNREPRTNGRVAAIDLGVRIAAALKVPDLPAQLYSARAMLKDWDYFGRRIAQHMAELARRSLKSSRRLLQLYAQRTLRWQHAWETLAGQIASRLAGLGVTRVFIGHPKNILRECRYSRLWNGRIHAFWGFGKAIGILKQALAKRRIAAFAVGERGSSSTCPVCESKDVVRAPRQRLTCKGCGAKPHSDAAGAANILFMNTPATERDRAQAVLKPVCHRWNDHRWQPASNRSATALRLAA